MSALTLCCVRPAPVLSFGPLPMPAPLGYFLSEAELKAVPLAPVAASTLSDDDRDLMRWADDGGPCYDD